MKRIVAVLLCVTLLCTGCAKINTQPSENVSVTVEETELDEIIWDDIAQSNIPLDDERLLTRVEELVYNESVRSLNSDKYFVENVSAIYISKEYLKEITFNSQSNIYFGYTLSELDELFQGTRYIFTLGENGQTTVQELQEIEDISTETMLKNIAIGTGVILVCVTVSIVSSGVGGSAVSMIFAASAKRGALMALYSGGFGAISAGIVRGIQTGNFDEALDAAAMAGSEGFKWGAIIGSISGGLEKTVALYGATRNGLTMNQAALIQQESKLPLEFIKNFHSVDEYNVYKNAGLALSEVNGKLALTQKIDWDFIGDLEDGRTNAQRVLDGLAPLDSTGASYELHHIGQRSDSPLAILTSSQHKSNYSILHANTGSTASNIERGTVWNTQRREFWTTMLKMAQRGG